MRYWNDADFYGNYIDTAVQTTLELCMEYCLADRKCNVFVFDHLGRYIEQDGVNCWRKTKVTEYRMDSGFTSGMRCTWEPDQEVPQFPTGQYPGKFILGYMQFVKTVTRRNCNSSKLKFVKKSYNVDELPLITNTLQYIFVVSRQKEFKNSSKF